MRVLQYDFGGLCQDSREVGVCWSDGSADIVELIRNQLTDC